MLGSDVSSPSRCGETYLSNDAATHWSYNPQKGQSSKLLSTSSLKGVDSEQDKVPFTSSSKHLPYTKSYSKTSNDLPLSINCVDDDDVNSTQNRKSAIGSQAFFDSVNITTIPVEESELGQKQTYTVVIGHRVRTVNTKLYSSMPLRNKFMVKQREQNLYGVTRVKLVLKSSYDRLVGHVNI